MKQKQKQMKKHRIKLSYQSWTFLEKNGLKGKHYSILPTSFKITPKKKKISDLM